MVLILVSIMYSCSVLWRNSWLLQNGPNLCDTTEHLWVLTENHINFSESKPAHRDGSEYHPDHSHIKRGGSKTHPRRPTSSFQPAPSVNPPHSFTERDQHIKNMYLLTMTEMSKIILCLSIVGLQNHTYSWSLQHFASNKSAHNHLQAP